MIITWKCAVLGKLGARTRKEDKSHNNRAHHRQEERTPQQGGQD